MTAPRFIAPSDVLPNGAAPKSVAGKWRLAKLPGVVGAGQAPGNNSVRLYPFYINDTVTIDQLALAITTISAAGNAQAAIYASDPVTQMPTGSALVSSASISTGATGAVAGAVTPRQFTPGLYWAASNCDNAVAIFLSGSSTSDTIAIAIGSATLTNVMTTAGPLNGFAVAATFGTWSDLTSATLTELNTTQRIPVICIHAQSVP